MKSRLLALLALLGFALALSVNCTGLQGQELFVQTAGYDSAGNLNTPVTESAFTIQANGSLAPVPNPLVLATFGVSGFVVAPSGQYIYTSATGNPLAYAVDANTGEFQIAPGWSVFNGPWAAGSKISSLVFDSTGSYLYATTTSAVIAYSADSVTSALMPLSRSPFPTIEPTLGDMVATANGYLYVVTQDYVFNLGATFYLDGFSIDKASGELTRIVGMPIQLPALVWGVSADPFGRFLFATSGALVPDGVLVYGIDPATGKLTLASGSPFAAGQAAALTNEPSGRFLYGIDSNNDRVFGFAINPATGALTSVPASPFAAGNFPSHGAVDPSGQFLYVGNIRSNTISGWTIDPVNGSLAPVPGSPFPSTQPYMLSTGLFPASRLSASLPGSAVTGSPVTLTVTARDRLGRAVAHYPGMVHFTSSDRNADLPPDSMLTGGTRTFEVTLGTPGEQTVTVTDVYSPSITVTGSVAVSPNITVVNAANLIPGAIAPNTIVSAFGQFPGCGASAAVTVNGISTSTFYGSSTQINFLIPPDVSGATNASIQFVCGGMTFAAPNIPIMAVLPALFTSAADGSGQVAVVNQDGTIDTPSPRGSVIEVFGTGFGLLQPADASGLVKLVLPVTALIGNTPATVLFAGQAPGFTTGLQQIDLLIPADIPTGSAKLVLAVGQETTQAGVMLVIE